MPLIEGPTSPLYRREKKEKKNEWIHKDLVVGRSSLQLCFSIKKTKYKLRSSVEMCQTVEIEEVWKC